ncbi:MAG: GTP 3',8-cyclase MoaA [Actinobacteria bacterium]|nr:GTP 3',8-cyclase MoaA [Actinomycetota bacterium]
MNAFFAPRADAGQIEPLVDGHGRTIGDLRVSVTDLCNLRCQYCMPPEGVDWLDHSEVLSFEEIARLVDVFASLGVHSVRLTGGEPLVRREFPKLAAMIGRIGGIEDLSITTNGFYLERDATALVAAGIHRFNVSLDALDRKRFAQVTRRDVYDRVIAGLQALEGLEGVTAIKVNAVAMRGFTEHDVLAFAELARTRPYQIRFIEYMPIGADDWRAEDVLTGEELRAMIETAYPLVPTEHEPHATARVFRFADGDGEIGFINPVSQPFCGECDRVRLTADGKLRTCLFSHYETNLRDPLRGGAGDEELRQVIRDAVWRKELKHAIGDEGFRKPARTMSSIGG